MKRLLSLLLFCNITISFLLAQPVHQVKGTVIDKSSRQPLEFINVMIVGLNKGGVTNAEGKFSIGQVPPGIYRLQASAIGYKTVTTPEYILSTRDLHIQIEMEENQTELEGVTVTASPFRRDIESPVSLRIIGLQEIEKSPGANRDISRIVQSYPGVAFSPIGYRNDLIVRGGSPSENRFYLDGVEIPNINHFSTQGASGGPVGILNADLIPVSYTHLDVYKRQAGCGEDTFQPMQFIYPPMNARIKLPKQLDGSKGFLTVELAHNNPNATVFWHLDETYQAQTQDFHKIPLQPAAGKHSLTAVDGEGNTISTTFFVE